MVEVLLRLLKWLVMVVMICYWPVIRLVMACAEALARCFDLVDEAVIDAQAARLVKARRARRWL